MKPFRAAHLVILALFQASIINARSEARDQIHRVFGVHNPLINTHAHKINSDSSFDITFALEGNDQAVKLILEPNRNILGKDAHVQVLDGQGIVRDSRPIERQEHKVFKGSAWVPEPSGNWQRAGWARIYVKRDGSSPLLEGVFSVWGDHHHIQPRSSYLRIKRDVDFDPVEITEERMVVYRDSDMVSAGERKRDSVISRCPADELSFNSGPDNPIFGKPEPKISWNSASRGSLANRQIFTGDTSIFENLRDTIGSTDGCPTSGRVALIGIATDCSYTAAFESTAAVRDNLIAMVNAASDVYERTFNVTLGLQNLTISDAACPATAADSAPWNAACPTNGDIESTLESFSQWRGERNDDNAYWTMMTTCGYGGTVGLAWLGQLCVSRLRESGGQSVTGANVVVRSPGEWQVFAHETAHIFGAVHDCNAGQCELSESLQQCCPVSASGCDAGAQYLMNPSSSRSMTDFSPCTIGNICSGLGSNMGSNVIVGARKNAEPTLVVIRLRVNTATTRSVMMLMKLAAPAVSSHLQELSAEKARDLVILKRRAPDPLELAQLTCINRTETLAEIAEASSALKDNAPAGIFSVKPW
ncbi:uncharacterized protein L3040_007320 [Drepanopeziza brunnea f. sp. 'multigermtubi']|uniref:uncharacterized protein n=1 Tax=Drepanopeziza brunnea f. sp. 'multigermtubi' TaxID=698441 RepID=UPI00239985A8|nr:hypothetical protein L3040_007320 [Drepanopeziza brunnea f. sp. 'multigermtubi']